MGSGAVAVTLLVIGVYIDWTLEQIRDALKDVARELEEANRLRREKR